MGDGFEELAFRGLIYEGLCRVMARREALLVQAVADRHPAKKTIVRAVAGTTIVFERAVRVVAQPVTLLLSRLGTYARTRPAAATAGSSGSAKADTRTAAPKHLKVDIMRSRNAQTRPKKSTGLG